MKFNKSGTTIVESMVVMLILVIGITGALDIYKKSQDISINSKNKLVAIDIAREGIEAVTNIRDTNWLLYSANNEQCWNTLNYQKECLTATNQNYNIEQNAAYILIFDSSENRWTLTKKSNSGGYSNSTYKNNFIVKKDANGFYCQGTSGCSNTFDPTYTREIFFNYPTNTNPQTKVTVKSIVRWAEAGSNKDYNEIVLETTLSNWINPFGN